jgi:hypothetical protein
VPVLSRGQLDRRAERVVGACGQSHVKHYAVSAA